MINVFSRELGVIGEFDSIFVDQKSDNIVGVRDGIKVILHDGHGDSLQVMHGLLDNVVPPGNAIDLNKSLVRIIGIYPKIKEFHESHPGELMEYLELAKTLAPIIAGTPPLLHTFIFHLVEFNGMVNLSVFRDMMELERRYRDTKLAMIYKV